MYENLINIDQEGRAQLSASEFERNRRRLAAEKTQKNLAGEMCSAVIFIMLIIVILIANKNAHQEKDPLARTWLAVSLAYYISEFIL